MRDEIVYASKIKDIYVRIFRNVNIRYFGSLRTNSFLVFVFRTILSEDRKCTSMWRRLVKKSSKHQGFPARYTCTRRLLVY